MNISKAFHTILFSGILLLFGCRPQPEQPVPSDSSEYGMFSGCTLPCWLGIELGHTTGQSAKEILIAHYGIDYVDSTDPSFIQWSTAETERVASGGWVRISEGTVVLMGVDFRQGSVDVGSLIDDIGFPEYALTIPTFDGAGCAGIALEYPSLGVHAPLFPYHNEVGVFENQSIQGVVLNVPSSQLMPIDDQFKEWEGYKDYCPDQ